MCLSVLSGQTYDAVAAEHGVTRERVRQLVMHALRDAQRLQPIDGATWWLMKLHDLRQRDDIRTAVRRLAEDA
jgi:hypothetical protein